MTNCTGTPAEQWLESYLAGTLPEDEARRFEEHYFDCPTCLAQVEALQAVVFKLGSQPRKALRSPIAWPIRWSAVAAIAALLMLGFFTFRWSMSLHVPAADSTMATLRDGDLQLSLDKSGQLHGAEGLSPNQRTALKTALASGRLVANLPANFTARPTETMLGAAIAAAPFKVLSPIHCVVIGDRPTFAWEPLPAAGGYRVRVYAAGYRKIVESPLVHGTRWQSTLSLPRGQIYTWTVTAKGPRGELREPAPPQPEAAFQVMAADAAAELETARSHADSHLLLAVLYARAGAVEEARAQVDLLAAQNPGSSLAAQLRASLNQAVPSPINTNAAQ